MQDVIPKAGRSHTKCARGCKKCHSNKVVCVDISGNVGSPSLGKTQQDVKELQTSHTSNQSHRGKESTPPETPNQNGIKGKCGGGPTMSGAMVAWEGLVSYQMQQRKSFKSKHIKKYAKNMQSLCGIRLA